MSDDLVQKTAQIDEQSHQIDTRLVTFTLGDKDYAIDIMKVKEISSSRKFTHVPNAAHYVRGVFNLRGDIIPVIDLRLFFNLARRSFLDEPKNEEGNIENLIILSLENTNIAIIVDTISYVMGVPSAAVQQTHQLFSDINIRYIQGVVENEGKLYIILDVDRIIQPAVGEDDEAPNDFSIASAYKESVERNDAESAEPSKVTESVPAPPTLPVEPSPQQQKDIDMSFLSEGVAAFAGFHVSALNNRWFEQRAEEWIRTRRSEGKEPQFSDQKDAEIFLRSFSSPYKHELFPAEVIQALSSLLPDSAKGNFLVWNYGCEEGFEAYSVTVAVKEKLPEVNLRVRAGDRDLLSVSGASQLTFSPSSIPEVYARFMAPEMRGTVQFGKEIKDSIIFEFQDIVNSTPFNELDIIIIRDKLAFIPPDAFSSIVLSINESLKRGGLLIVGDNEDFSATGWEQVMERPLKIYKKI